MKSYKHFRKNKIQSQGNGQLRSIATNRDDLGILTGCHFFTYNVVQTSHLFGQLLRTNSL